nr:hypothetical protein [Micromonospora sp. DSM 115978]
PRALAVVAGSVYAAALVVMASGTHSDLLWLVVVGLVLSGLAFGHTQPPLLVIAGNAAPAQSMGLATSLQQTMMQIGAVIGMSLLVAIVADSQAAGPFVVAYGVAGVLALSGAVATATCSRRVRTRSGPAVPTEVAVPVRSGSGLD